MRINNLCKRNLDMKQSGRQIRVRASLLSNSLSDLPESNTSVSFDTFHSVLLDRDSN